MRIFNKLIATLNDFETIKRACGQGAIQIHRLRTDTPDPNNGLNAFHDKLSSVFNQIADLEAEVKLRFADLLREHDLEGHGFSVSLEVTYTPERDKHRQQK